MLVIINDNELPETQKRVLEIFKIYLNENGHSVLWTSSEIHGYRLEVATSLSAKRLGFILFYLKQLKQPFLFFDGNFVPGEIPRSIYVPDDGSIAASANGPLLGLNAFLSMRQDLRLLDFLEANVGNFDKLANYHPEYSSHKPVWVDLHKDGVHICERYGERPWYAMNTVWGQQWMDWVIRAIKSGRLNIQDIQRDVNQGRVRPSLLIEIDQRIGGEANPPPFDGLLDVEFKYPELCLTKAQRQLLFSKTLQRRTAASHFISGWNKQYRSSNSVIVAVWRIMKREVNKNWSRLIKKNSDGIRDYIVRHAPTIINILKTLRKTTKQGWCILWRDYRVRFRRAIFGFVWLLVPLVALAGIILSVGGEIGLYAKSQQAAFTVKLIAGLIYWQYFVEVLFEPLRMARRSRTFLKEIPFEPIALVIGGFLSAFIGLLIRGLFGLIIIILTGKTLEPDIFLTGFGMAGTTAFGVGIACLLMPASLVIMDIRYVQPFIQYAGIFATPILYSAKTTGVLGIINAWNPLTYLVPAVRDLSLGLGADKPMLFFIAVVSSAVLATCGVWYINKKLRRIAAFIGR